jgi:hypothetical protein
MDWSLALDAGGPSGALLAERAYAGDVSMKLKPWSMCVEAVAWKARIKSVVASLTEMPWGHTTF